MEFTCPHCQLNLSAERELAGRALTCPGCNGRIVVPGTRMPRAPGAQRKSPRGSQTQQASSDAGTRGGWPEADHANVPFWTSLGIGVAATALLLLLLLPFKGQWISDLFLERTWVNYAETFLFCWSGAILFLKFRKNRHQRDAMLLDVLPAGLGASIGQENVGHFIDHLYRLPRRLRDSLMVNRIRKGLELFEKRRNNGEVASMLASQSDIDANRISGSYTLLKVFLWAIPILGFIGTVLGLSVAVGSMKLGSTEEITGSMKYVTGGLGTAFDTTLLGLVLSMLLSFPLSAMQKAEEENLTVIDAFCLEKLLPRLDDGGSSPQAPGEQGAVEAVLRTLSHSQETFLSEVRQTSRVLHDLAAALQIRLTEHQERVEAVFDRNVTHLRQEVERSLTSTTRHIAGLEQGIRSLNTLLGELGGKQVVIQQVKRGWFGKRS